MERYEAYKDSGVEWIGEIPESWIVQRFRWTLKRVSRQPVENDEIVTCFRDGEVTLRKNRREDGFTMSDKEIGYQHICAGDFVIHGMDGFAGAMGISDSDGKASPVLMAFQPIGTQDLRYINYLLRLYAWRNVFLALSTTIRVRSCDLNWAKVAPLPLALPSYKEQQAIADYLDAKTAEIDALVADCEREVGLLREYRKAVISEAVTKGLDPDAPMKDSGIEWIGEIPAGWYCAKLGLISVSTLGRMLDTEKQTGDCLAPYLSNRDVQWFRIDDSDLKEMDFPFEIRGSYEIHDGDLLVCEGGEVGRSTVWHGPTPAFYFQKAIHRVRFDTSVMDPDFAAYQMFQKAQVTMFREVRKGESTIGHLPGDQLRQLTFAVPPLDEQHDIVAYLDAKTAEIDSLIEAKQQMADKLREYRKSLISEAVTGKFKVPGV